MQNRNEEHSFKPLLVEHFTQLSNELFIENKTNKDKGKNSLSQPNLTAGTILQLPQTIPQDEDILVALAEQTAKGLVHRLDQLSKDVAYRIALMFEPYLQIEQELDFSITPKPSRRFIATVTRREEPEPELYLD